jgi:hypothetical protein
MSDNGINLPENLSHEEAIEYIKALAEQHKNETSNETPNLALLKKSEPQINADPQAIAQAEAQRRVQAFSVEVVELQKRYGVEIVAVAGEARIVQRQGLITIEAAAQIGFNVDPNFKG